ncbi:MAG: T9SS type A sorting domain-containing protein [candidate division WOR-3 bacterium]|nr:MAG: T9SS type A sorting domain-containing protein [candidate division WOR-3 bacterium]
MGLIGILASIASSALFLTDPVLAAMSDTFELREVARVPYWTAHHYAFGDADHDGHPEFYALGQNSTDYWVDYILEHRGNWEFDTTQLGWDHAMDWDVGDPDRDGKSDLLVQVPTLQGHLVCAVESPDPLSLPDSIVWKHYPAWQGHPVHVRITDLDADSALEIAECSGSLPEGIQLYENTGDNRYELKTVVRPHGGHFLTGFAQTHDMDRDGLPELVAPNAMSDDVQFFEAVGDDTLAFKSYLDVPVDHAYSVIAAPDMDRDGRSEVVVFGVDTDDFGFIGVIESPCDDSFEFVWQQNVEASYWADGYGMAVGDVDGDSLPEFAVTTGLNVHLYRCTGNDSYEEMWRAYTNKVPVGLHDLDGDGRCELLYRYSETTVIMQYGEVSVEELLDRQARSLQVWPSATRGEPVRVTGMLGAEVEVLDAAGSVVARPRDGVWNPRGVSPGAYFVRVRSGSQVAVRKVLVLP